MQFGLASSRTLHSIIELNHLLIHLLNLRNLSLDLKVYERRHEYRFSGRYQLNFVALDMDGTIFAALLALFYILSTIPLKADH